MKHETQQHTASPVSNSVPRGSSRCRAHNRAGSRCRLPVHDPSSGLCFRHLRVRTTTHDLPDSTDLSPDLFGPELPSFDSAERINAVLSKLVILVAQGRISSRRASVLTYALSLILRGVVVINRQAAAEGPQIIFDAPRPILPDEPNEATANSAAPSAGSTSASAAA